VAGEDHERLVEVVVGLLSLILVELPINFSLC